MTRSRGACERREQSFMPAPVPPLRRSAGAAAVAAGGDAWRRFQGTIGGEFVETMIEMRVVDRALALASKLFIAILPMSILVTALVSGEAFGQELVSRFGLTGGGADAARTLFATPAQVQAGMGLLGVVILTSSIVSFASVLQRLYLDCWKLDALAGAARARLLWLAGFLIWLVVVSSIHEAVEGSRAEAVSWLAAFVAGGAFFLWTPYVLLGRRIVPRRLLVTGLASGVGLAVLAAGSDLIMPDLVTHNTARYGLIGLTFSLVSWLFCGAVLVVCAAILGAFVDRRLLGHRLPAESAVVRSG
jgi:membrane protein